MAVTFADAATQLSFAEFFVDRYTSHETFSTSLTLCTHHNVVHINCHNVESAAHPHNEEYCPMAIHNPLTGYELNLLDNFDFSETFAAIFQDESGDMDTEPSYSCDAELDDEIIGKALSFRSEKNQRT